MKKTNLREELIENNGDANIDGHPDTIEHTIGEMIVSRSDSVDEIAERTADLVAMLQPADAYIVFRECNLYARARLDDLRNGDFSCVDTYDAVIDGLAPWLAQHGFPRACPVNGFTTKS